MRSLTRAYGHLVRWSPPSCMSPGTQRIEDRPEKGTQAGKVPHDLHRKMQHEESIGTLSTFMQAGCYV